VYVCCVDLAWRGESITVIRAWRLYGLQHGRTLGRLRLGALRAWGNLRSTLAFTSILARGVRSGLWRERERGSHMQAFVGRYMDRDT